MTRTTTRTVVASSITVVVSFGCVLYGFSVYATDVAAGAVFSTSMLSLAFSGTVATSGLCAIPLGRIMDRTGVRSVVPIGGVLVAVGLALFSQSTQSWQLLAVWWLLIGPGTAAVYYEPTFVAVNQWVPEAERAKALGWLTVIGGLAGAIFIPLLQRLTTEFGWRNAVLAAAATVLLAAMASGMALPGGRGPHALRRSIVGGLSALRSDRVFLWFTAAMVLAFIALQGVIIHRLDIFGEAGFDLGIVAAWAGIASLISLPGRYVGPVVGDRTSLVGAMVTVMTLIAVSTVLASLASSSFTMTAHFLVFGLAFGAVIPLRALIMIRWYAGDRYGAVMGVQKTATLVGGSLGPLIVGVGRDMTGGYTSPLVLITGIAAASAFCVAAAGWTASKTALSRVGS